MRRFRRYSSWSLSIILVIGLLVAARYWLGSGGIAIPHAANGSSLPGRLIPGKFEVVRVERADLIIARQRVAVLGRDVPQEFELPVQLLGVRSPVASEEGVEYTRKFLSSGSPSLDLDRRRVDTGGHFLAYVYVDGELLNQEVIRAGLGQADLYPGDNQAMHKRFVQAENEAKRAERGIWASKSKQ